MATLAAWPACGRARGPESTRRWSGCGLSLTPNPWEILFPEIDRGDATTDSTTGTEPEPAASLGQPEPPKPEAETRLVGGEEAYRGRCPSPGMEAGARPPRAAATGRSASSRRTIARSPKLFLRSSSTSSSGAPARSRLTSLSRTPSSSPARSASSDICSRRLPNAAAMRPHTASAPKATTSSALLIVKGHVRLGQEEVERQGRHDRGDEGGGAPTQLGDDDREGDEDEGEVRRGGERAQRDQHDSRARGPSERPGHDPRSATVACPIS